MTTTTTPIAPADSYVVADARVPGYQHDGIYPTADAAARSYAMLCPGREVYPMRDFLAMASRSYGDPLPADVEPHGCSVDCPRHATECADCGEDLNPGDPAPWCFVCAEESSR